MKPSRISYSSFLIAATLVASCVEPYEAPYSDTEINFLVIDGFLDSGAKTARVKLSVAVPLDTSTTTNPVQNATVWVERDNGSTISLTETAPGLYTANSSLIETGNTYRLRVINKSKEYISDDVELKASPVLDSVTWRADDRGITIYVDSHDVEGSTRYYQWIYNETWEYSASNFSTFKFIKETGEVVVRRPEEMVYICYSTQSSTKVLVSTTTSNTLDVVNDFPLHFIPVGSPKISRLFSIEVEQRALDEQAYTYWLNLQRTTENLGSLFDPLPSEVTGNIHNVGDLSERVLGYFTGGEIQKKRLFISRDELPTHLLFGITPCETVAIPVQKLKDYIGSELFLTESVGQPTPTAYLSAPPGCIDCRLQGGVLQPPPFWPPR